MNPSDKLPLATRVRRLREALRERGTLADTKRRSRCAIESVGGWDNWTQWSQFNQFHNVN